MKKIRKISSSREKMSLLNSCVLHEFQRSEKNIPTYIQGIEGAYRLKCQSVELRNENSLVLKISCYAICRMPSYIEHPPRISKTENVFLSKWEILLLHRLASRNGAASSIAKSRLRPSRHNNIVEY